MQSIKNIFWNSDEHRVRALWRLIGQVILLFVVMLPLEGGIGFAAFRMLMVREGITADQLADPQVTREMLSPQAVQNFIISTPSLMMLSSLAMLAAFVLSVWLAGRFLDRRPFANFGFHFDKNWWADLGFGLALGAFLMLITFVLELAAGWITVTGTFETRQPDAAFLGALALPLLTFLSVGFYEELFSRGYQLQNIAEGLSGKVISPQVAILVATLLSSAVFGVLHAGNPNASVVSTINLVIAGVFLALGYILTGELAISIGLHITWNFFQGNVFGFPVSGGDYRSATFVAIQQGGPDLWTGGAFGPEAGLIGLGMIMLGSLLIALWVRWRYGRVELQDDVAHFRPN
jgi:membrane protease YdiL (CAAX protease family)